MLSHTIRLGVVDDHILFRKTLTHFLSQKGKFDITFDVSDTENLLIKLKSASIDVLLLDMFLPRMNGKDALTILREKYPEIKVIILSMCSDMDVINDLLDIGIYGYISKTDDPDELLAAIRAAFENKIYRNRIFTEALYWNTQKNVKSNTNQNPVFLDREKQIIKMIWEEKSSKEIADQLYLSVRSIEKTRQEIKEKLGVKTTVGILKYALNKKLISISGQTPVIKINSYKHGKKRLTNGSP